MTKVVIGIATCKRPTMLEKALRSLETLQTEVDVRVFVADNDATNPEGITVVDKLNVEGYRFALDSVVVEERGIPYARNAIANHAFRDPTVDSLVFMDDDQWVEPQWLDALLRVQRDNGADVVAATVVPDFLLPPPAWVRGCRVYYGEDTNTSGLVGIVYSTNGVLLSSSLTSRLSLPWFDENFPWPGGDDAELFARLRLLHARFARASAAIIHETYPASRVTLRWALQRAYRIGGSDIFISRRYHPGVRALLVEMVKITGAIMVAPVLVMANIGRPGRQVDAVCKISRACGKIAAMSGFRYHEYATIHGR